jgi:hypothetical protein
VLPKAGTELPLRARLHQNQTLSSLAWHQKQF